MGEIRVVVLECREAEVVYSVRVTIVDVNTNILEYDHAKHLDTRDQIRYWLKQLGQRIESYDEPFFSDYREDE